MNPPPFDLAAVERATVRAVERGDSAVFQTHFYAQDDRSHVARLLEWLAPSSGDVVIDAGCGVGEVSRLMAEMRPDLAFLLVNVSPLQLELCPSDDGERFLRLEADCHDLRGSVPDAFAEAIMYSSALCQMDAPVALAEACRVLKTGGVLLINDMAITGGDAQMMENVLAARVFEPSALAATVQEAGFEIDFVMSPESNDAHFRALLEADGCDHVIEGVSPIIIRAIKRGEL